MILQQFIIILCVFKGTNVLGDVYINLKINFNQNYAESSQHQDANTQQTNTTPLVITKQTIAPAEVSTEASIVASVSTEASTVASVPTTLSTVTPMSTVTQASTSGTSVTPTPDENVCKPEWSDESHPRTLTSMMTYDFNKDFYDRSLDFGKNSVTSAPSAYVPLAHLHNEATLDHNIGNQFRKIFNWPTFEQCNFILDGTQHLKELNRNNSVRFIYGLIWSWNYLYSSFYDDERFKFNVQFPIDKYGLLESYIKNETIGSQIREETYKKIQDFITKETSLNANLTVTNAAFFKGNWTNSFDKSLTKKEKFYLTETKTMDVTSMTAIGKFDVGMIEKIVPYIELPYKDLGSKMIIMVPPSTLQLNLLKTLLKLHGFDRLKKISKHQVLLKVSMPKFYVEYEINLKETLISMGLTGAFGKKMTLSLPEDKKIGKFIQKTLIEINENWAEIVSGNIFDLIQKDGVDYEDAKNNKTPFPNGDYGDLESASAENGKFKVNKPFIFLVQDSFKNNLYMGYVNNPTEEPLKKF